LGGEVDFDGGGGAEAFGGWVCGCGGVWAFGVLVGLGDDVAHFEGFFDALASGVGTAVTTG